MGPAVSHRRCHVSGVLNVTPDSFSDGGTYFTVDKAVAHGLRLAADGADVVDVGGESTRPGATRTAEADEMRRVLPVVRELTARGIRVSIDTMRASVAEAAVNAGAIMVNDVSGGLADPAMARCVAELEVPYVAMHWRGHSATMARRASYDDVVHTVKAELGQRLQALQTAGIKSERIIVDPGLGFAKTSEHNWTLLRRLGELAVLGPLMVGASRKRFLTESLPESMRTPADRDLATAAISALAAVQGAAWVRVHDVGATIAAVSAAEAATASPASPRANAAVRADDWPGR
ncbi:dihydropteroate synthase [Mycolicibacterium cosmeticum]|uniref:dihydropteroate synthase n=1 Tax=Mycolicibacterium cosmeticum TaxID=258533 RepID=UPI003204F751